MNQIAELLDEVVRTGALPTDEGVASVITKGRTVADRHEARRQVMVAAKRIRAALDSPTPEQAMQVAEDACEVLAAFTTGGDPTPTGRDLAAGVPRTQQHAPKLPAARSAAGEPLRELLGSRVRHGIKAVDLDALATRSGATAAEVSEWRRDVLADSRTVAATWATGAQAAARRLADEYAAKHAHMLAELEPRDPHEDVVDPRSLGALVPRGLAS